MNPFGAGEDVTVARTAYSAPRSTKGELLLPYRLAVIIIATAQRLRSAAHADRLVARTSRLRSATFAARTIRALPLDTDHGTGSIRDSSKGKLSSLAISGRDSRRRRRDTRQSKPLAVPATAGALVAAHFARPTGLAASLAPGGLRCRSFRRVAHCSVCCLRRMKVRSDEAEAVLGLPANAGVETTSQCTACVLTNRERARPASDGCGENRIKVLCESVE